MFKIGEVISIKEAFKANQEDDKGNKLPLGSIKVRVGGNKTISGNILHRWCRPASFNRRIPLQFEQVLIFAGPATTHHDGIVKEQDYFYVCPINAADDLVLHQLPYSWWRHKGPGAGPGAGATPPGMNFPDPPKRVDNIQPFAGDDIWESRLGSSIRLGQSVQPVSGYDKTPTWQGGNADPITILRVLKPTGGPTPPITPGGSGVKYTIEDISKDDVSIYMTTTQKLMKAKVGFTKSLDSMKVVAFTKPQIYLDADRVVVSGKKDMVIVNGKEKVVIAGKKVFLQSDEHFCDLDVLLTYIKDILTQLNALTSAQAQFATPAGPTAIATNMAQVMKLLQVDFVTNFKVPK